MAILGGGGRAVRKTCRFLAMASRMISTGGLHSVPVTYNSRTRLGSCYGYGIGLFHRPLALSTTTTQTSTNLPLMISAPISSWTKPKPARVMDGELVAKQMLKEISADVSKLKDDIGVVPCLATILVGTPTNYANAQNRRKKFYCESTDIKYVEVNLPEHSTEQQLLNLISDYNDDPFIHGISVQYPLPNHMDQNEIVRAVNIDKDVDGYHPINTLRLFNLYPSFLPCMSKAVLELLRTYDINMKGKSVTAISRPNDTAGVMTPLYLFLTQGVTTAGLIPYSGGDANFKESRRASTNYADIIISTVGEANLISGSCIKPGAVVIDFGINPIEDEEVSGYGVVGDVCFEEVKKIASYVTPVPGGVGPVLIAALLSNTLVAAKRMNYIN